MRTAFFAFAAVIALSLSRKIFWTGSEAFVAMPRVADGTDRTTRLNLVWGGQRLAMCWKRGET